MICLMKRNSKYDDYKKLFYSNLEKKEDKSVNVGMVVLVISIVLAISSYTALFFKLNKIITVILFSLYLIVSLLSLAIWWVYYKISGKETEDLKRRCAAADAAMKERFGYCSDSQTVSEKLVYIECIKKYYEESSFGRLAKIVKKVYFWMLQVVMLLLAIIPSYIDTEAFGSKELSIWIITNIFIIVLSRDKVVQYWFDDEFIRFLAENYRDYLLNL